MVLRILLFSEFELFPSFQASAFVANSNRNIAITDINPQYVWGGDCITLNDCDLVWIDHVTVRLHSILIYFVE